MALIPTHGIDKEAKDLWIPFVGVPSCNYPMTGPFWILTDETFWKKGLK